jgi:hypothetical protein
MAAKRYNRRSRDEWKSWVAKWKASGLGGTKFAEQHGISGSALYRWSHIFEDEAQPERDVAFKPVRVRGTSASASSKMGAMEIVAPSGWVVRVVGDVEADRLRAVLEVVGAC